MPEIEIFTGPNCVYCAKAKALLIRQSLAFKERDISEAAVFLEIRTRLPRIRSIPQVFVNGEHIGGFEDLDILINRGDERLRAEP
ncbi:MAG: glutaredoxin domain-containing protein [Pseudomonadota bacterium]